VEVDHGSTIDLRFRASAAVRKVRPRRKSSQWEMASIAARELTVLHVAQPNIGGVPKFVCDLAADQTARGWHAFVAGPAYAPFVEAATAAGAVHIDWTAERAPGPAVVPEALKLARIIRRLDPDVVHLHSSKAGMAGRLAVRGSRPTVFQPHAWSFEAADGAIARAALLWERVAARWTHTLLCVSQAECQRGEAAGIHSDARIVVNGVDLQRFAAAGASERAEARRRLGFDGERLVVCVGRLIAQKGQDVLIDAWTSVAPAVPGSRLVLVGDGPARASFEQQAGPEIVFAGEREDVADWLAAADLVAFPSRWEGMSLAMLEAMACARSVVATDVDGAREALDGEAGAIVPPEDPDQLAAAIVARLRDPELAAREGAAGRRRVERNHDVRRATDAVAGIYAELVGQPATRVAVGA
jgi:glycosyltransferase involved in cell wall biosynthesis